jgi:hypothetical protein
MIDKIKPTIAIRSKMRLIFSETESIECGWVCFGTDLNDYEILIAQPVNDQDFCGKSFHWRPVSPQMNQLFPYFSRRVKIAFRYDGESEEETRSVETTSAPVHTHGEYQAQF